MYITILSCFLLLSLVSGLLVVYSTDVLYSLISLLVCSIATSIAYIMLGSDLLGMITIIVHAGGVVVMLLFALMSAPQIREAEANKDDSVEQSMRRNARIYGRERRAKRKDDTNKIEIWDMPLVSIFVKIVLVLVAIYGIFFFIKYIGYREYAVGDSRISAIYAHDNPGNDEVNRIASLLYGAYAFEFSLIGLLIFIAVVVAVMILNRYRAPIQDAKKQSSIAQVLRKNEIRLLK